MKLISASIVFYCPKEEQVRTVLNSCLDSNESIYVYIIDNSPTDEVRNYVSSYNRVEYIHCPENIGFGAAHNLAMFKSVSDNYTYHAIVNPDIYFSDDVIGELAHFLQENKSVGVVMPKILYPNGDIQRLCKLYPTPINLFFRRFLPFQKMKQEMDYKYEMHFFDYDTLFDIPLLSGCFLVLKTEVIKKGCHFDERYFMYLEDYDFCRSVRDSGWRLMYYPNVSVYHEFEKGSHKNVKLLKYHIDSALSYFNKWGWIWDKKRKEINKHTFNSLVSKEK